MNKIYTLEAKTISDAWFQLIYNLTATDDKGDFINAYPTGVIQQGSFMNEQSRLQFRSVAICIEYPLMERIVKMPEGSNIPAPTSEDKVTDYFYKYIVGAELEENETYTYGSRIMISLPATMEMLKNTPVTNQAVIEVAQPDDTFNCIGHDGKLDPPCLRLIGFKVIPTYENGELSREKSSLDLHCYFRSWDLYAGLPENLAGLSMLQEMVSEYIDIPVGCMYAYSEGLHLYKYQKEIAEMRTRLSIKDY